MDLGIEGGSSVNAWHRNLLVAISLLLMSRSLMTNQSGTPEERRSVSERLVRDHLNLTTAGTSMRWKRM